MLVTQSGQTLEKIVASVKKVSDIVAEIAAASREQSSGIEQVNRAVMQMDELTQQNAALVEEATAASQAMAEQVRGLNEMLARYRVAEAALETQQQHAAATPAGRQRRARADARRACGPPAEHAALGGQSGQAACRHGGSRTRRVTRAHGGRSRDRQWRATPTGGSSDHDQRHNQRRAAMARILAVDDSAAMRQMVGITLTGAGHQVEQAVDGCRGPADRRSSRSSIS